MKTLKKILAQLSQVELALPTQTIYYHGADVLIQHPNLSDLEGVVSTLLSKRVSDTAESNVFTDAKNNLLKYKEIGCTPLSISSKEPTPVNDEETTTHSFCERSAARRLFRESSTNEVKVGIPVSRELKMRLMKVNGEVIGVLFPAGQSDGNINSVNLTNIKRIFQDRKKMDEQTSVTVKEISTYPDGSEIITGTVNPASFLIIFPEGTLIVDTTIQEMVSGFTNLGTTPTFTTVELPIKSLLESLKKTYGDNLITTNIISDQTPPEKVKDYIRKIKENPELVTKRMLNEWMKLPEVKELLLDALAENGLFTMPIGRDRS